MRWHGLVGDMTYLPGVSPSNVLPGVYTVDTLPDPSGNIDKYARVTDLFGGKRDLVLASQTGALSYWQPVRPIYGAAPIALSGNMTILPLKMPSVIRFSGNIALGVTRQVTVSTALAWPGAQTEILMTGTVLGVLNVLRTGLASTVSLLTGGYRKFTCEIENGALAWKQLL